MNQLQKYGSMESTIHQLNQKINKLNNDAESLEAKKKQLNDRNRRMFSMLGYSKQITYYFKGMIDSLKDEILMRHVVLAYVVSYTLNLQLQMIPKLDDSLLGEFAPILRAAKLESNRRYHHHHHHANDNNTGIHYDDDDDDIVSSSSSSSSTSSSINELQLKAAIARAIQLLINNLKYSNNSDDNISLIEILDTARHALEKEPNHH